MCTYKSKTTRYPGVFVPDNVDVLDCAESWEILSQRFLRNVRRQPAHVDFPAARLFGCRRRLFRLVTVIMNPNWNVATLDQAEIANLNEFSTFWKNELENLIKTYLILLRNMPYAF